MEATTLGAVFEVDQGSQNEVEKRYSQAERRTDQSTHSGRVTEARCLVFVKVSI